jgi:hypothetical protein
MNGEPTLTFPIVAQAPTYEDAALKFRQGKTENCVVPSDPVTGGETSNDDGGPLLPPHRKNEKLIPELDTTGPRSHDPDVLSSP